MGWRIDRRTRRGFLRGLGGTLVGLPLLPSLVPRESRAEGTPPARRFVTLFSANGHHRDIWLPSGTEHDFSLSPVLEPLEDHRDQLIVAHNLHGAVGQHAEGMASVLTAAAGQGPSIDQLVAQSLRTTTRLPSLEVSVQNGDSNSGRISYAAAKLSIPALRSPKIAFDRIFAASSDDPLVMERLRAQNASVLDSVVADIQQVNGRLSASERPLLEAHLDMVRDLEQRLSDPPAVGECDLPVAPDGGLDVNAQSNFPLLSRLQIDNVVAALACDITRVATIVLSKSESRMFFEWLSDPVTDDSHSVAHGAVDDPLSKFTRISAWYAGEFAYLLDRLASIPSGEGTLLDDTVALWSNELGLMSDWPQNHQRNNMAVVLAGSCGGHFRTGRLLDMQQRPYGDLMISLGHAMGLDDLTTFGTEGTAPLDALM